MATHQRDIVKQVAQSVLLVSHLTILIGHEYHDLSLILEIPNGVLITSQLESFWFIFTNIAYTCQASSKILYPFFESFFGALKSFSGRGAS